MIATRRSNGTRGQSLVILAFAVGTIAIAVAVTIDGGNAFAQQRAVQNGSDAAALAGAVELGNRLSCTVNPSCGASSTDANVLAAINSAATANGVTVSAAYYTDVCGTPLKGDGTAALQGNSVDLTQARKVGNGFPAYSGSSANCALGTTGPTAGVLIHFGHRDSPTYVASIVGINSFAIDTQSTAVSTYGTCGAQQGCALLPVAFPRNVVSCDKNGNIGDAGLGAYQLNVVYVIPLCTNSPGNVGWIDWTPKGGGVSPINNPGNSPISFPSWQYVAQSGRSNNQVIQADLRALGGQIARIVQFDHTCGGNVDPNSSLGVINDPTHWYGCPSQANLDAGNGSNLWYRLPLMQGWIGCTPSAPECQFGGHSYEAAYTKGNAKSFCDTGNGATQCLVGKFVTLPDGSDGTNGAPVQLIK